MVLEKLGGIHYAHSVQHSFISPSGQNQQLGFVQNPVSVVPASGAVVGTTELRYVFGHNNTLSSCTSTQCFDAVMHTRTLM